MASLVQSFISIYAGVFGSRDGSLGAAILAVVLVHVVIAGYVYTAWKEGETDTTKKD